MTTSVECITRSVDGDHEPLHHTLCTPLRNAWENIAGMHTDFIEMISDISQQQANLTRTEARYALEIILALSIVQNQKATISQIMKESERNEKITSLTGLIAEPGLFPGNKPDEILVSIMYRIDILKEAYWKDKKNQDTISLWKEAFKGPPCFNGRLISLEVYVCEKINLRSSGDIENLITVSDQTDYDEKALEMLEIMYEYNESEPPPKEEFREYISSQISYQKFIGEFDKLFARANELFI